jgi:hypothetical protein
LPEIAREEWTGNDADIFSLLGLEETAARSILSKVK